MYTFNEHHDHIEPIGIICANENIKLLVEEVVEVVGLTVHATVKCPLCPLVVEEVVEVLGLTVHATVKCPLCWHTIRMMTTAKVPKKNFMVPRIEAKVIF